MEKDYWISGYDLLNQPIEDVFNRVLEYKTDVLIVNHAYEWFPYPNLKILENLCFEKSIKIKCILAGPGTVEKERLKKEFPTVEEFIFWPTYWFFFGLICQDHQNWLLEQRPRLKGTNKHLFLAMNGQPHLHRCYAIDYMHKINLAQKGKFNWFKNNVNSLPEGFSFKWFSGEEHLLADGWRPGSGSSFKLPIEFDESALIFITESQWQLPFISEKTVQACLRRKPFLILGGKGQNKVLENLGFELMHDIFNYSFDEQDDVQIRVMSAIHQLNNFTQRDNCFLLENNPNINKILVHNHKNVYDILKNRVLFPDIVNKVLDTNDDRFPETKFLLNIKNYTYNN